MGVAGCCGNVEMDRHSGAHVLLGHGVGSFF